MTNFEMPSGRTRRFASAAGLLAIMSLLAAACGGGGSSAAKAPATTAAPATTTTAAAAATNPGGAGAGPAGAARLRSGRPLQAKLPASPATPWRCRTPSRARRPLT